MANTIVIIVGALVGLVALPFIVLLCAKLGVYGALRGRQIFEQEQRNGLKGRSQEEEK